MESGKTTIMRILQCLMNYNFAELIKYDFESIDIEASAKNGKMLKDTIRYADLLPTDDDIKNVIMKTDEFIDDLYQSWRGYVENVSDEEKINCFSDESMTDEEKIEAWNDSSDMYEEFENGNINPTIIDVLSDLIEKNELKNLIRKIIKKEEFDYLYFDEIISKRNINDNNGIKFYYFKHTGLQYDSAKMILDDIISIIKTFLEDRVSLNREINFINKKEIIKLITVIKNNTNKPVDILDMTRVYNFGNELLTSSLITHKLLEWKSTLPSSYSMYKPFAPRLRDDAYSIVLEELKNGLYKFENTSNDISTLNATNTIDINSIINHYFYNEEFIIGINKKALEYYVYNKDMDNYIFSEHVEEDIINLKNYFSKYIRPILIRNSPLDDDFYTFHSIYENIFCDFIVKERHLFEENKNPKIIILQELLDKYMMNKDVEVTPMGVLVKSKEDNRTIPLDSLSAGEKKLLVIFMHCLFNEDVPIIIDEPEISLSIIWQENLLPDLLEKTNIKQVIVATHSSAIISDQSLDKYIIPLPNSLSDEEEFDNE